MGACYCFMAADEKVGNADERADGEGSIHLSDALVTAWREPGGGGREHCEQAHLYVWRQNALPPQVWLTARRRASHFFFFSFLGPYSSTHGLAMTFTSFEAKSGSRFQCLAVIRHAPLPPSSSPTAGRKEKGSEEREDSVYLVWAVESQQVSLSLSPLKVLLSLFDTFGDGSFDKVSAECAPLFEFAKMLLRWLMQSKSWRPKVILLLPWLLLLCLPTSYCVYCDEQIFKIAIVVK